MTTYSEWTDAQEKTTITVDGHDLDVAYRDSAAQSAAEGSSGSDPRDEGSGDPVIFLHGIPTNSYLWRDVVEPIADERRVVVPDMIGYGNSATHDGFDRSLRAQEAMIDGLLDDLGIGSVSLVGHDLGGGVFLRFAAHNPDRVEKLVLSNSVAYDSWPIGLITDLGLPETARETSPEELQETLEGLFRDTLADEADEEFVAGMKAPWNSAEGVTSLVRNAVSTNTSHTTEIDPEDVTAETLLLWGADDEFQPIEWAERLEADIETAELVGLDDAVHWVMEDRPDAYREELEGFLLAK